MKAEVLKLWTDALRSGDYVQGQKRLKTGNNTFCCLGVLCDLYAKANPETSRWVPTDDGQQAFATDGDDVSLFWLPVSVIEWAGLKGGSKHENRATRIMLPNHNDGGAKFEEIATMIEGYQQRGEI